jgi:hypothetical protein
MKLDPITEELLKRLKEDEFDKINARQFGGAAGPVAGSPADIARRKRDFERQRAEWNKKGKK